jgi:hypothetical protein
MRSAVSKLRYLNPFRIRNAAGEIRRVMSGGGLKLVRLTGVGRPEGIIVPTSTVRLELQSKTGRKARFEPTLPVPWTIAWPYRIGRALGLPLLGELDPERLRFELRIPRRGR